MTPLKIEEGKYYRNGRGEKVGPMKHSRWLWVDQYDFEYADDGTKFDYLLLDALIEEWTEPNAE